MYTNSACIVSCSASNLRNTCTVYILKLYKRNNIHTACFQRLLNTKPTKTNTKSSTYSECGIMEFVTNCTLACVVSNVPNIIIGINHNKYNSYCMLNKL